MSFVDSIVGGLRSFASVLIEPGISPSTSVPRSRAPASLQWLVGSIQSLTSMVPRLLQELSPNWKNGHIERVSTHIPKRGFLSRRPSDYVMHDNQCMPQRWNSNIPVPATDRRPLRWLLHMIDTQSEMLSQASDRMDKHIPDLVTSTMPNSQWAELDRLALADLQTTIEQARGQLKRARLSILHRTNWHISPSPYLPQPFPFSPEWTRLRLRVDDLIRPQGATAEFVRTTLLAPTTQIADLPFLYQRWCGMKLIHGLQALRWELLDDPIQSLFLGGQIRIQKSGIKGSLWVETRIPRSTGHPSGLQATWGDCVSPDFVLIVPGPGGNDAYIVDPTLARDPAVLASKGKYLQSLAFQTPGRVAGAPSIRSPLRSWAAAPLTSAHCRLLSPDGSTGTIPMHPEYPADEALLAWLADIDAHAQAWSNMRPDSRNAINQRHAVPGSLPVS